ncbi:hypothetical protein [Bacillus sp. FJAT-27264]|uniref:hypothetical protein n=1 Tax=Paenibacillus sp. (strain DSM 101736 / FJAT-27264) TaxID=1850362 RepID=UPI001586AAC6|nr:hypothetical protein [Bacillus sp. FJAT-27264]
MKNIFITILLFAITLTGFKFFIADGTTGLWGDGKTIKTLKDTTVTGTQIPNS